MSDYMRVNGTLHRVEDVPTVSDLGAEQRAELVGELLAEHRHDVLLEAAASVEAFFEGSTEAVMAAKHLRRLAAEAVADDDDVYYFLRCQHRSETPRGIAQCVLAHGHPDRHQHSPSEAVADD